MTPEQQKQVATAAAPASNCGNKSTHTDNNQMSHHSNKSHNSRTSKNTMKYEVKSYKTSELSNKTNTMSVENKLDEKFLLKNNPDL